MPGKFQQLPGESGHFDLSQQKKKQNTHIPTDGRNLTNADTIVGTHLCGMQQSLIHLSFLLWPVKMCFMKPG